MSGAAASNAATETDNPLLAAYAKRLEDDRKAHNDNVAGRPCCYGGGGEQDTGEHGAEDAGRRTLQDFRDVPITYAEFGDVRSKVRNVTKTWGKFADGFRPENVKRGAKDGPGWLQGANKSDGYVTRGNSEIAKIWAIGIDCDKGSNFDAAIANAAAADMGALLHTSYTSGQDVLTFDRADYEGWCARHSLIDSLDTVKRWLQDVEGYVPEFVDGITIYEISGDDLLVRNPAGLDKFRTIVLLASPESMTGEELAFIHATVAAKLGVKHDPAAARQSQPLYYPRRRSEKTAYRCEVVEGRIFEAHELLALGREMGIELPSGAKASSKHSRKSKPFNFEDMKTLRGADEETRLKARAAGVFHEIKSGFDAADLCLEIGGALGLNPIEKKHKDGTPYMEMNCARGGEHSVPNCDEPSHRPMYVLNARHSKYGSATAICLHSHGAELTTFELLEPVLVEVEPDTWRAFVEPHMRGRFDAIVSKFPKSQDAILSAAKAIAKVDGPDRNKAMQAVLRDLAMLDPGIFDDDVLQEIMHATKLPVQTLKTQLKTYRKNIAEQDRQTAKDVRTHGGEVLDIHLAGFNERYAFATQGSDGVVLDVPEAPAQIAYLKKQTFLDLHAADPSARAWWQSDDRRTFRELNFRPDKPLEYDGTYDPAINLYRGLQYEEAPDDWTLFRGHIFRNLAQKDVENAVWIMNMCSDMYQNPATKPGVALVLMSEESGTGKSKFFEWMCKKPLGPYATVLEKIEHVTGRFNSAVGTSIAINIEEALFAGDQKIKSILKDNITSPTAFLERKFFDGVQVDNFTRYFINTNNAHAVSADTTERRYACFEVGRENERDTAFFKALDEQMYAGGVNGMLYDLMRFKAPAWSNLRVIPKTALLADQKGMSFNPYDAFVYDLLEHATISSVDVNRGKWTFAQWETGKPLEVSKDAVLDALKEHAGKKRADYVNKAGLTRALHKYGVKEDKRTTGAREPVYRLPPLDEMRAKFANVAQMEVGGVFPEASLKAANGPTDAEKKAWEAWFLGEGEIPAVDEPV